MSEVNHQIDIEEIAEYLKRHKFASIATCHNGRPYNATIRYASESTDLFFSTLRTTDKAENILCNPNVALTIDDRLTDRFLQYRGEAFVLNNEADIRRAIKNLEQVYKYARYWITEPDVLFFWIKAKKIKFTDGSSRIATDKYFGNVVEIEF